MFKVEKLTGTVLEKIELTNVITASFSNFGPWRDYGWMTEFQMNPNDIKLMYKNKIVGFHFFEERSIYKETGISWKEDAVNAYKEKKGLQGIIMGILPEYTRMGGGTLMIQYEKDNFYKDYDYIWGGHYKDLNNIDFWLKDRRLIGESENGYYTIMDLK